MPVVAKADTLTKGEMDRLKVRLRSEIAEHGIRVYQLPDCDTDEDEEYKEQVRCFTCRARQRLSPVSNCPAQPATTQEGLHEGQPQRRLVG